MITPGKSYYSHLSLAVANKRSKTEGVLHMSRLWVIRFNLLCDCLWTVGEKGENLGKPHPILTVTHYYDAREKPHMVSYESLNRSSVYKKN